ncbi:hypothetical protein [Mesorhizobium sp. M7A.F.Ca.US.008.03.1.1]|uniref:hypothetical protein n=1 Tax=Mesorhizobium sp. M7A.F.Ca.US.008.03.1.1 TaxID=2496742 RepID=UPI0013DF84BA|nr:hypothetical protein [Mesorhizobium sp. M7A.F.Ca.US.008.03.1.1]
MRFATFLMTLESSTNMQRFISGSSLPSGSPVASGHPGRTIGQSGKEAEKALGKIFAKMGSCLLLFTNALVLPGRSGASQVDELELQISM